MLNLPSQTSIVKFSSKSIDVELKKREDEDSSPAPVESSKDDKTQYDARGFESEESLWWNQDKD